MADSTGSLKSLPGGVNRSDLQFAEAPIAGVVTATTGSLTLQCPPGVDPDLRPIDVVLFKAASASPQAFCSAGSWTHDPVTGQIVATGFSLAAAAGDRVVISYMVA